MKLKKTAVKATLVGAMGAAAVGLGAGMAQADPFPAPPPWPMPAPADPGVSVEGPSLNAPGYQRRGLRLRASRRRSGRRRSRRRRRGRRGPGFVERRGAGLGRLHERRLPAGLIKRMGRSPRHVRGDRTFVGSIGQTVASILGAQDWGGQ